MKTLNQWSRAELLALPKRQFGEPGVYDSVIVMSTGKKHCSGYAMMAIIGCIDLAPVAIASMCSDDITWTDSDGLRTDCLMKSRAVHFWKDGYCFEVSSALSSIDITLCLK